MNVTLEALKAGNVYERKTGRGRLKVWAEEGGLVMDWEPVNRFRQTYPPMLRKWEGFGLGPLMRYASRISGNPPTAKHRLLPPEGKTS